METDPTQNIMEETNLSTSEKIKVMILGKWDKADSYYCNMEDQKFVRASKVLGYSLFTQLKEDQKKELEKLKNDEYKEIKEILADKTLPNEVKVERIRVKQFDWAEKRMEMCVQFIDRSPIVTKDFDVDVDITDMDLEELRSMVQGRIPEAEGGRSFRFQEKG